MLSSFKVMQFIEYIKESNRNIEQLISLDPIIEKCIDAIIHSLRNGGTIFFCGNGGSAADSQHLAAELMGRFLKDRKPLKSIALTVDTSALTAIGNDYGFEYIFSRELEGLGKKNDCVIFFSTSGNSKNLIRAADKAKSLRMKTISITGNDGGKLKKKTNLNINIDSNDTARIQECHLYLIHILIELIEIENRK